MMEYWSAGGGDGSHGASTGRVRACLHASDGESGQAALLYRWERGCSMALFELLLEFEAVLRSALDLQLARWNAAQGADEDWLRGPVPPLNLLVSRALVGSAIASARREARMTGFPGPMGRSGRRERWHCPGRWDRRMRGGSRSGRS